jgi:NodT family efflux transporter outer membrane factor (OMF) lipoprotein
MRKLASTSCVIVCLGALLGFTGCITVGPDYQAPADGTPDAWSRSAAKDLQGGAASLEKWWQGFQDPTLNTLIDRARAANPGLQAAVARITEARAQRGIAASQFFPQANLGGDYSRNRFSESLLTPAPAENPSNLFTSGFDSGWEIDIFGGIRRSVEAAEANIGAREEDYRDTLVTLFADVALNYVEYRTLEVRIATAEQNIAAQRESVGLTQSRLDAGLVPRIDVTQAETNLALSEALIPQLRAQLVFARNRLASLAGGFPGSLDSLLNKARPIPIPKSGYAAGLPADLLRARPDIRRAERELAAQTARIGVAESDLYPRFTLFGDFSLQSINSGDFFDSRSRVYSFGPSFQWQIFSAGRIRNAILAEESQAQQALSVYENAVLDAVEEVETGMANVAYERERNADLQRAVTFSTETVALIKDNYENGLVNFQNVLDAERTKFNAMDEEIFSRGQIAKNYIVLYKALGGGVECEYVPATASAVKPLPWKRQKKGKETLAQPETASAPEAPVEPAS